MSSALLQQYLGTLNGKQSEYLQIIHDSGQHLLELINDILDLSKIEAGKASLEISSFSLHDVACSCLALLREKAQTKKVQLTEELTNLSPSEDFSGDERRIKQILLNLLSNAVKFTPAEGQVWLKMRQEGNTAIIEVVDNGIGIPEHKQHLVFERFEQLNHHHEGTGLGLALTRQLVEMHGGTIEFTSTVGKGTAFIVRLQSQPES
jgi:two-component system sensor histidine kinase/response regulator